MEIHGLFHIWFWAHYHSVVWEYNINLVYRPSTFVSLEIFLQKIFNRKVDLCIFLLTYLSVAMLLTFNKWKTQQTNFIFLKIQAHHGKSIFSTTKSRIYQNTPCWRSEATSRWTKSKNSKSIKHNLPFFRNKRKPHIFHFMQFNFFLFMNTMVYIDIDEGISMEKSKVAQNEKQKNTWYFIKPLRFYTT